MVARIMTGLAQEGEETAMLMMDVEQLVRHRSENRLRGLLKAHRTASSLRRKKAGAGLKTSRLIGRMRRGRRFDPVDQIAP